MAFRVTQKVNKKSCNKVGHILCISGTIFAELVNIIEERWRQHPSLKFCFQVERDEVTDDTNNIIS